MKRWKSILLVGALLSANLVFLFSETSGSETASIGFDPWGECGEACDILPGQCYSFCVHLFAHECDDDENECPDPGPCPECVPQ